jgi:hypothetical protein
MTTRSKPFPAARAAGLLAGSVMTLAGVVSGLPPEEILRRVVVGTAVIMVITRLLAQLVKSAIR